MRPASIATFAKDLPPCIIAMEACCGAHHLGRLLAKPRSPNQADVAGICAALHQGAKE
jgi:transposase